ncbi:hypothetical protein ACVIU7_007761 [Bradyrhizobium liaoningense]
MIGVDLAKHVFQLHGASMTGHVKFRKKTVRDAIPKVRELAAAEFATLRLRLLKIAARVVETTSRIRLAFAAACPEADLIRGLPGALLPLGP